jgi:membrane-bound metal-dependent hydrolase YbcI (DUF457 family)
VWYSLPLRKVHTNIMMGPAHSLSGAAVWLGGSAAYTIITGTEIPPAILIMGTAVFAGAALVPDLDSYSATATKSFGIFGRLLYYIVNSLSMLIHGATRTKYDKPVENGHRTFMHTTVGAALLGVLTLVLTSLPGHTEIFGKQFATGQLFAIGIMFFFLHLGLAGLFSKQIKKAKKAFGPYLLMLVSLAITVATAAFLPTAHADYQWLAIVVAAGAFTHILGDTITKMGTPMAWPVKIRGKRWYDVSLPTPLRITAGGSFEMVILTPLFILVIAAGIVLHVLLYMGLLST